VGFEQRLVRIRVIVRFEKLTSFGGVVADRSRNRAGSVVAAKAGDSHFQG
jgi:hypothetical protein